MSTVDSRAPEYSRAYERLVSGEADLRGLLAYAFYKQHKRAWVQSVVSETGRPPDLESRRSFELANCIDVQLRMYRRSADQLLEAFGNSAIDLVQPMIREEAIRSEVADAVGRLETASSWYRQIPAGLASAFAYTLFLIAIALVLRYAGIDVLSILQTTAPAPAP